MYPALPVLQAIEELLLVQTLAHLVAQVLEDPVAVASVAVAQVLEDPVAVASAVEVVLVPEVVDNIEFI